MASGRRSKAGRRPAAARAGPSAARVSRKREEMTAVWTGLVFGAGIAVSTRPATAKREAHGVQRGRGLEEVRKAQSDGCRW